MHLKGDVCVSWFVHCISIYMYMYTCIYGRVSYRIFCLGGGGEVFSHGSTKHVNEGGSGGIPPGKNF